MDIDLEKLVQYGTPLLVGVSLLFKKVREGFSSVLNYKSSKAKIKLDTSKTNIEIVDGLMDQVNDVVEDNIELHKKSITREKAIFELQLKYSSLEFENKNLKSKVDNNCTNNCLDV